MVDSSERRIIYVLCLVVLALGLFALSRSLDPPDTKTIGVSLGLIALAIGTAIAASRSGRVSEETGAVSESDGEPGSDL